MSDPQARSDSSRVDQRDAVVIRFSGDSGDGMQLAGGQFTATTALFGNDIATFPDFPAEIRAPRGTTFGVSGFQLQFASTEIHTEGDRVNVLMAMNPAGLKVNLDDVEVGGIIIANEDEFTTTNLLKCGYPEGYNPLEDDEVNAHRRIIRVPMSRLTRQATADLGLGAKDADRCRNMFALGIAYWLFERSLDSTIQHLNNYYGSKKGRPEIAQANIAVLKAGYHFGETAELFPVRYQVPPAKLTPGTYRRISGNAALALGLATAASKADASLLYASYPITPASDILHALARLKHLGVTTFQAEDEIAAVCAAIGASYAGNIGVTGTSGPGLALKAEAVGLAVIYELPLVVVDVQRAGPATGMPTKTEQADLLQAMFGRAGESPVLVLAPQSPADCFAIAIEAVRLAVTHMCPAIILSDGYLGNGAEPWRLPDLDAIDPIEIKHPAKAFDPDLGFRPYIRDPDTLARAWALPGTPGLEHRIGSLEKAEGTGAVSYDPDNHDKMIHDRAEKIQRAARTIAPLEVRGPKTGDVLLLGWGGTYGAISTAGDRLRDQGLSVATASLRHLNPMPVNLPKVLASYETVIIPEINLGQLSTLIRSRYLIDAVGINVVRGRAFRVGDLVERVEAIVADRAAALAAQAH